MSVSGSIEILMTDYGIKPPEALFGLIITNDNVYVKFDLRILPSVEAYGGSPDQQIQDDFPA